MKLPLAFAVVLAGCGAGLPSPYLQKQLDCVDAGSTRAEVDACRCAVKATYKNPCDAGADAEGDAR